MVFARCVETASPFAKGGRTSEFPNVEVGGRTGELRQLAGNLLGARPSAIEPLQQVRHTITRYRITLDVFRAEFADGLPGTIPQGRWCSPAELDKLAFPSAHRKILSRLQARSGDGPRHWMMTNPK